MLEIISQLFICQSIYNKLSDYLYQFLNYIFKYLIFFLLFCPTILDMETFNNLNITIEGANILSSPSINSKIRSSIDVASNLMMTADIYILPAIGETGKHTASLPGNEYGQINCFNDSNLPAMYNYGNDIFNSDSAFIQPIISFDNNMTENDCIYIEPDKTTVTSTTTDATATKISTHTELLSDNLLTQPILNSTVDEIELQKYINDLNANYENDNQNGKKTNHSLTFRTSRSNSVSSSSSSDSSSTSSSSNSDRSGSTSSSSGSNSSRNSIKEKKSFKDDFSDINSYNGSTNKPKLVTPLNKQSIIIDKNVESEIVSASSSNPEQRIRHGVGFKKMRMSQSRLRLSKTDSKNQQNQINISGNQICGNRTEEMIENTPVIENMGKESNEKYNIKCRKRLLDEYEIKLSTINFSSMIAPIPLVIPCTLSRIGYIPFSP